MPEIVKVIDLRLVRASLGCLGVGTTLRPKTFTVFCRNGVVIRVLEPYSAFFRGLRFTFEYPLEYPGMKPRYHNFGNIS